MIKDYIKVYKNILTSEECDMIISYPYNDKNWEESLPVWDEKENYLITSRRKCDKIEVTTAGDNYIEVDHILYTRLNSTMIKYIEGSYCSIGYDTGYTLLRYNKDGGYIRHIDAATEYHRRLSTILLLNDDFEGGELTFFGDGGIDEYTPNFNKGDVIIFPSDFMYPHTVKPITSGKRYVVVTWFR